MGKGTGVILLILGLLIIYSGVQNFGVQNQSGFEPTVGPYALWIGIIFAVVGLFIIIFSRSKQPPLFR